MGVSYVYIEAEYQLTYHSSQLVISSHWALM